MHVALTGASGFVGSHVLEELVKHDHEVTALVRGEEQADIAAARGATPVIVDLYDRAAVVDLLRDADGAIHTASPGDATSADLDSAVVDAAIAAYDATGKPYIQISGLWIYGNNTAISEQSPLDAPALVAFREPIDRRVMEASGMRGVVIVAGTAYGDGGGGVPGVLLGSPRDDAGNLIMLGAGRQHWATVHVADLASAFRLALESDSHAACTSWRRPQPTVAELTEAAATRSALREQSRARTRRPARAWATTSRGPAARPGRDRRQGTGGLAWEPTRPLFADELRGGSYRAVNA